MQKKLKLWRESASIIILAKNLITSTEKWNYKILTLKRSKNMKFMPNLYTFPGGVLEKSDCVKDWLKLYESFNIDKIYFNKLQKNFKLPIFKNYYNNELPKYISTRICAIRETFEECGILLCKPILKSDKERENWASCIAGGNLTKDWQNIVRNDSNQFINMCYELKIYPDICSLHEWSNWLTPFPMPQQFDTIFFLVALEEIPPTLADENEIQSVEWSDPFDYLKWNNSEKIMLAPPQFYEISKLTNFHDINNLIKHAHLNSCEQILPYRVKVSGKDVTILPGDELYPEQIKLRDKQIYTTDKLPGCKTMHRINHPKGYQSQIVLSNFKSKYVSPFVYTH